MSFASGVGDRPELPGGREFELPDRGSLFVRDIAGPSGAPTVFLLHGWTATADINFFTCYRPLAERYRVVAFDHRGHGRGLRSRKTFRLEDCADDVVAVADELGVDTFVPIGYSMGGPIAQLAWQRHRERVDGLVLCATSPYFAGKRPERLSFMGLTGLAAIARFTPAQARDWITDQVYLQRRSETWGPWAAEQVAVHDWRAILEAGRAIGEFSSSDWIRDVDVPTSIVVTMDDPVVPVRRQAKLFDWIPDAEAFRVAGGHDAVVANAKRFVPQLLRAADSVVRRAR
ncbi:MAG: alpha/beta hydrolase [Ilumatobacter sp.]|nr:alpha/beta hydrolase [Ilumatobacter sp.]